MSARDWSRAIAMVRRHQAATLPGLLLDRPPCQGDAPALLGAGTALSYAALAAQSWGYAHWAIRQRIPRGAVIALLMGNGPDYVAIWLGLTRAGHPVALLNPALSPQALAACLRTAGARHGIAAAALAPLIAPTSPQIRWWRHGACPAIHPAAQALPGLDAPAPGPASLRFIQAACPPPVPADLALLIYTSGTTGPPKAVRLSHRRIMEWSAWFAGLIDAAPADRLYDCLPLYHSTGGVVGIGAMLLAGGSVVIRERFSAGAFWNDVAGSGCTLVLYIGELCRYLLAAPSPPAHRVRLFCGNGLRHDVWQAFQSRFSIPRILEFYAATEGSVSLYNVEGRPGAIGRVPPHLALCFPIALIRIDPDTDQPLRDAGGRCVPAAPGQAGEAIGRVDAARPFDGYTDDAATAGKLLHDVFAAADRWFRTGDLMRRDEQGFYYFIDRIGDSFRWKGENVAATEVQTVLTRCPGVKEAAVYGVEIPGAEGRAGMAALVVESDFAIDTLAAQIRRELPSYARPLFVRLCRCLDLTGTFKLHKVRLKQQGYHDAAPDPVWFVGGAGRAEPFDQSHLGRIIGQNVTCTPP